jgi:hypothetical protein
VINGEHKPYFDMFRTFYSTGFRPFSVRTGTDLIKHVHGHSHEFVMRADLARSNVPNPIYFPPDNFPQLFLPLQNTKRKKKDMNFLFHFKLSYPNSFTNKSERITVGEFERTGE